MGRRKQQPSRINKEESPTLSSRQAIILIIAIGVILLRAVVT